MWRKNTQKTNITTCVCDRRQTVEKNTNTHSASHLHRTPACFIFSGQIHNHAVWIKTLCVEKKHTEDQHQSMCSRLRCTASPGKNSHSSGFSYVIHKCFQYCLFTFLWSIIMFLKFSHKNIIHTLVTSSFLFREHSRVTFRMFAK